MGSCAAPSAKGDDKFITTDYLQQCQDGRSYWPVKRQAATADRIANHKGRNPQERASLKKRLLTL
ncbi:hypothetical protein [Klebsiella pneumoniae]|uniref:hypothetical protein n=1 Tax=Klebsiella pneumoniae TaxID=573 RepID=UPI001082B303|nr:hypothetical protein [Klebsiella pneumoniae]